MEEMDKEARDKEAGLEKKEVVMDSNRVINKTQTHASGNLSIDDKPYAVAP